MSAFKPGALITLREREWIVQPSVDPDVLRIKPLGGHEIESTGVYLPLLGPEQQPQPATFPPPSVQDLADLESAQLLYDAARLALRTGAGPFRSFGRLSVRPRPYQLVPLIMALKQEVVRLLIADDVGIGKTIEALLIVRELVDRGLIERFAVICPPHLCDQWQGELKDKFGFDAEVVRSDTAARLDRQIQGDTSVFRYYPYQVISIDYIKSEQRRQMFLAECPEFVIVDEAHTCARPAGAQVRQQQRHHLVHDISRKEGQHLVLLTATPHSGKEEAFKSLLGMLKPKFEEVTVSEAPQNVRRELAQHYVQRRRVHIERWIEDTEFPQRIPEEVTYSLSPEYQEAFNAVLEFARGYAQHRDSNQRTQRMRYWTALGLLRGVISSPLAGETMLQKRAVRLDADEDIDDELASESLFDPDAEKDDNTPTHLTDAVDFGSSELKRLEDLASQMAGLQSLKKDNKVRTLITQLRGLLDGGFQPIVFCRYIQTANHVAEVIAPVLEKAYGEISVEAVTSELNDEQRRERVGIIGSAKKRVLVATDCLSEGINLQEHFTAVIHYDLPWNPNRIEQREGRVDRFGQAAKKVKTLLMIGDNPIDGVIVRVLLRKTRKIYEETGISIPFPEDSRTVTDAITQAVLLNPQAAYGASQLTLGLEAETVQAQESAVDKALEEARLREVGTRSIFAQHALKPEEIEPDLRESDEAIGGSPDTVQRFISRSMAFLGVQMEPMKRERCYRLVTTGLPPTLADTLPDGRTHKVTFHAPVPDGYLYLGRNHPFVEQACQFMLRRALDREPIPHPARAAVAYSTEIREKTTLALFRIRNVISDGSKRPEIIAEEMLTWGYRGDISEQSWLEPEEASQLLESAWASANMSTGEQAYWLSEEISEIEASSTRFDELTRTRTQKLVDAHERYRRAIGGARFSVVEPVWPPDLLGLYVLVPKVG